MSEERTRRLRKATSTAVVSKGVNFLVTLLSVFVMARRLGPEAYGLWVTLTASLSLFLLLDIGIASALTNLLSEAYAHDDREAAARHFSNAFWMVLGVTLLLAAAGFAVVSHVDVATLLHVQDPTLRGPCHQAVMVALALVLVAIPAGLATRVLAGGQRLHLANLAATAGSVLSLACTFVAVARHCTLPWLVAAFIAPAVLANLACLLWIMSFATHRLRPALRHVQKASMAKLLRAGGGFFLIQMAGLVVFNSDNFVIAHFRGAAEVTPYSTAWRLASYLIALQGVFMPALWPALSEAYTRGDFAWVRTAYTRLHHTTLLVAGVGGLLMFVFGRVIIRLWAGPAAVPSQLLLGCMCLWMAVCSITMNQSTLLGAVSRVRRQAMASVAAAAANLGLSLWWVQRFGALGVLLATLVSYIAFILLTQTLEVRNVLRAIPPADHVQPAASMVSTRLPGQILRVLRRALRPVLPMAYAVVAPFRPPSAAAGTRRRILLLHPGHIGDIVIATSTLALLRRALPHAEIGFVTGAWSAGVLTDHPFVQHHHRIDHWRFNRSEASFLSKWLHNRVTRRQALREIRALGYDTCIALLNSNPDLLNVAWAARIPTRVGFDSSFFAALATHIVPTTQSQWTHQSVCQAELLRPLGIDPGIAPPQGVLPVYANGSVEEDQVTGLLGVRPQQRPYVIVHPGTGAALKEMPLAFWREVTAVLSRQHTLLFTGRGAAEAATIAQIIDGMPNCIDASNRLSWGGFITAVRHAEALYGVDSMAGHVAAALGTPGVVAYHSAWGVPRWRPAGDSVLVHTHHLPCAPCHLLNGCAEMPCKQISAHDFATSPPRPRRALAGEPHAQPPGLIVLAPTPAPAAHLVERLPSTVS